MAGAPGKEWAVGSGAPGDWDGLAVLVQLCRWQSGSSGQPGSAQCGCGVLKAGFPRFCTNLSSGQGGGGQGLCQQSAAGRS